MTSRYGREGGCSAAELGSKLLRMTFGEFLVTAIGVAGYTSNASFARAAGVPTSSVSKWINDVERPTAEMLRRMEPVLHVPILELYVWAGMLTWQEARFSGPPALPTAPDIDSLIAKIADSPMSEEAKQQVIVELRRLATPKLVDETSARPGGGENASERSA